MWKGAKEQRRGIFERSKNQIGKEQETNKTDSKRAREQETNKTDSKRAREQETNKTDFKSTSPNLT